MVDSSGTVISMLFTQSFLPLDQAVQSAQLQLYQEQSLTDEITGSQFQHYIFCAGCTPRTFSLLAYTFRVDIQSESSEIRNEKSMSRGQQSSRLG
jgi:hypothetical protein